MASIHNNKLNQSVTPAGQGYKQPGGCHPIWQHAAFSILVELVVTIFPYPVWCHKPKKRKKKKEQNVY